MSDKETSTPKEIPLHEVVLQIMYEANKERPAELTVGEVHSKISDETIGETIISDVLRWLVVQKQVECASGKFFSLDRYEMIEQRLKEAKREGKELNLVTEDNPLHEVVLNSMYLASKDELGKFTLDDVYWMISDPKIQKSHVGDVLKWLLNQGRVDYLGGKYSLDQIEFRDQRNADEKKTKTKKKSPKKTTAKKKVEKVEEEKKPKIVIPPSEDELKPAPKKEKVPDEPKEQPEEAPVNPKPQPTPKPQLKTPVPEAQINEGAHVSNEPIARKGRMLALIGVVICVIYIVYLLFAINGSIPSNGSAETSSQVQQELSSLKSQLAEISEPGSVSEQSAAVLSEKVESIERLAEKTTDINAHNGESNEKVKRLVARLVVVLSLTFILFSWLLLRRLGDRNVKN